MHDAAQVSDAQKPFITHARKWTIRVTPDSSYILDTFCTIRCNHWMVQPRDFLKSLTLLERDRIARQCGTTLGHLNNLANDESRSCSATLAALLETASEGQVTRLMIKPKGWEILWPDLAASALSTSAAS